jgi:Lamin Tail Domain
VGADPAAQPEPAAEFVELYNNSASAIDVGAWTLTDNNTTVSLPAGTVLQPGQLLLVIGDPTQLGAAGYNCATTPFHVGTTIGNGLGNAGDRVILRDETSTQIDEMSYGSDTSVFNPSAPDVFDNSGVTLQRNGYPGGPFPDTNTAADWAGSTSPGSPCDVPVPVELMIFEVS